MKSSRKFEVRGEEHFTGKVLTQDLTGEFEVARIYHVIFTPAARTHWHSHSKGQTIIITSGTAWLAYKDGGKVYKKVMSAGETFHFTSGMEHWHGAAPGEVMEHMAITLGDTDWKLPVTEEEYYTESDHKITRSLTDLTYAFSDAEKSGDKDFFENHLSADLVFRRANGKVVTKKDFIDHLKTDKYAYNIPHHIQVVISDDKSSAVVSLMVSAKITDEPPIEGIWKNTRLYCFSENRWLLTGWSNEVA